MRWKEGIRPVGAELARRYGESKEVIHAALGHHDDLRVETPYTLLVSAADAISASRPGARRETLEKYVRRLEELESLVLGFPGVEQAYAIQAGREIRVLVDSQQLGDAESAKLCRDIAQSIQSQLDLSRRGQGDRPARDPERGVRTMTFIGHDPRVGGELERFAVDERVSTRPCR